MKTAGLVILLLGLVLVVVGLSTFVGAFFVFGSFAKSAMESRVAQTVALTVDQSVTSEPIPVNPEKHPGVNFELATQFAEWVTAVETQQIIADFGQAQFGQSLFYPSSEAWKAANE